MKSQRKIYVGIPAMNEADFLPATLDCIAKQDCQLPIEIYVCINQPKSWGKLPEKKAIWRNNKRLLWYLERYDGLQIHILDKFTRKKAWTEKKQGVGMARKTITDAILQIANDQDIFISMDSDTTFKPSYFSSLVDNLDKHPKHVAIAVPYKHLLTKDEDLNRAILQYEIYLRNYNLNLLRIGCPYAFTALGSAIVCRVKVLRIMGGFDSQASGEDFYFLRKLRKHGDILLYNKQKVYPSARPSQRTPFGTGKFVADRLEHLPTDSYPIFHYSHFDVIAETYQQIANLFEQDIDTEFIRFLQTAYNKQDLWSPLRKNYKTLDGFTKAFHAKADSLRIFQFLRQRNLSAPCSDEVSLADLFYDHYPVQYKLFFLQNNFSLHLSNPATLDLVRLFLAAEEEEYQKSR